MSDSAQYAHPLFPRSVSHHLPMTVAEARALVKKAIGLNCLEGTLLLHPRKTAPCIICDKPSRATLDPIRTVACNEVRCKHDDRHTRQKGVPKEAFPPGFYVLQCIALCEGCAGYAIDWPMIEEALAQPADMLPA